MAPDDLVDRSIVPSYTVAVDRTILPAYNVVDVDEQGRFWVIHHQVRRCLFQVVNGHLVYRVVLGKKFSHSDRPEHDDVRLESRVEFDEKTGEMVIRIPIQRPNLWKLLNERKAPR